jgi:isoquinoline 1-oxidoreductase beta subunit
MASHEVELPSVVSRRQVMKGAAGLTFAIGLDRTSISDAAELARNMNDADLSPWLNFASDGTISIMSPSVEMGQGSMTSQSQILAEDLDWDKVRIVPAPIMEKIYRNSACGDAMTLPSSAVCAAYYNRLRAFGAQVRRALLESAACKGGLPADGLHREPSVVVHIEAFAAAARDLDIAVLKQRDVAQVTISRKWSA